MSALTRRGFPALAVFSLVIAASQSAAAADAVGCKDPDWAPQRMAGYDVESCADKEWAPLKLNLPNGAQVVYGHRVRTNFSLRAGAKDNTAADARAFYVAAAEKAGAKLVSDPGNVYGAALVKNTAAGDVWYLYEHGSGNEQSTASFTLTTLQVGPLKQEVQAQAADGPLDTKAKPCKNPPWLVKQFADFKLSSCEGKSWDRVAVTLPAGARNLEGARLTVSYQVTNEKKALTAIAIEKNYVNALTAIGAKLVSDPNNVNKAVLTLTTPQREFWYIYAHGSGNEDSTASYSITTVAITPFVQEVEAQAPAAPLASPGKTCTNPPWLKKQFVYFKLADCGYRDFDSLALDLPGGKRQLVGRVFAANYALGDATRDPAALAVKQNYVNALKAIGAQEVGKTNDIYGAILMQKTANGTFWYIYRHGSGNEQSTTSYSLLTLEEGGPPPKTCTLKIYGVNFDFNKSTLRPDSEPVLRQVLTLFTTEPGFGAEVGGHTDNVGTKAYNMKLSAARADAVRAWLVAHGVAQSRLTAHGYGDTKPLVPNSTDENRFKNRRVELKRAQCKG